MKFVVIVTFTAPIVAVDTDFVFTLTVTDDFGASATGMVTVTVEPDTTAPTVQTWNALGVSTAGEAATTTITFAEPVALETIDFTVENATVDSVVGSDDGATSMTWTVNYTPVAGGTVSLTLNADSVTDRANNTGPDTAETRTGTASTTPTLSGLSGLDGVSGVTFADARIFYYAHALGSAFMDSGTNREAVLNPLTTRDTAQVLADAGALSFDLDGDGATGIDDAAVLYYSFALEGALGDGGVGTGIPAIRDAILTPLLKGSQTVEGMLQAAHALRTTP